MLDLLPNELLVNIFNKMHSSTAKNCRMLNSRMNCIIKREKVYKDKLTKLEIMKVYGIVCIANNVTKRACRYSRIEDAKFSSWLCKFRHSTRLSLHISKIHITKKFVETLIEHECLRKVSYLNLDKCTYEDDGFDEMMKIIPEKKLLSLRIEPHRDEISRIPKEILNFVSHRFVCEYKNSDLPLPNLLHYTDELLETWVDCSKTVRLYRCRTGFTFNGILKLFKSSTENKANTFIPFFHLGIIFSPDADEAEAMLKSPGVVGEQLTDGHLATFKISKFNDQSCCFEFTIYIGPLQ